MLRKQSAGTLPATSTGNTTIGTAASRPFGFGPSCTGLFIKAAFNPRVAPARVAYNPQSSPQGQQPATAPAPATGQSAASSVAARYEVPNMPTSPQPKHLTYKKLHPQCMSRSVRKPSITDSDGAGADGGADGVVMEHTIMDVIVPADYQPQGSKIKVSVYHTVVLDPEVRQWQGEPPPMLY